MYVFTMKRGGNICLKGRGKDRTWIQCQSCGCVYLINKKVSIEKSIVNSVCPECGGHVGLNCGDNKEDLYYFYDPVLDGRYY